MAEPRIVEVVPGRIAYVPDLVPVDDRERLLTALRVECAWSQERLSVRGVPEGVPFPRLVAWHGDPGLGYRYVNVVHPSNPWTPAILEVRALVTGLLDVVPNGCLLNWYRTGRDSIGRHSDAEDDLVPGASILGVSLGAARTMALRPVGGRKKDEIALELEPGSLLVMHGDCQDTWTHEIRKTEDDVGERISLTFRSVRT